MASNNDNYTMQQSKIHLLWEQGYTGEGITVGIVDTGVDLDHPMIKDKIIGGRNFSDDGRGIDVLTSSHYHGTGVSALVCGDYINHRAYGVAPNSKILIAKTLNDEARCSMSAVASAISYCVQQGVDIINCSVGCPQNDFGVENALRNAVALGIPVVVSSGNEGHNDIDGSISEISYPAYYDDAISVGAIDNEFIVADFSNSNQFVDIVAPGVNVLTAYPGNRYAFCDGTSYSAPIISGILALLKQKFIVEFGRIPTEGELYAQLIKNTRSLQGVSYKMQGNGYFDASILKIKKL